MDATSRPRRLIVTVHGIRTFGQWQERLESLVRARDPDARVLHYKYGYFSSVAFMVPFLRWWVTRSFRRALLTVADDEPWTRIDVVAHSFGTHLVGWGLHGIPRGKRPKVHTLILAGSVLKPTFPWAELTEDNVGRVVNDCGTRDTVLVLNQATVLFSGMAGRVGFAGMNHDRFRNRFFAHGHSGYFVNGGRSDDAFMNRWWLPVLLADERVEVPEDPRDASAAQGVASFVLNNAEPIKLALVAAPFALLALVYFRLYDDADRERAQARRRLTALQVASAERRADEGDVATAMLWYVEALRTSVAEPRDALDERDQRARLATALRELPELSLVLRLGGHGRRIARMSADGGALALDEPEGVRVWDVDSARPRTAFMVHENAVNEMAFSRDGALLATASNDLTARVWDARDGHPVTPPLEHGDRVTRVVFSPDATRVVTVTGGSMDGTRRASLWDVRTGSRVGAPAEHDDDIGDVQFTPDGTRVASIDEGGTTRLWTPGSEAEALVLEADDDEPDGRPTLLFDESGDLLATSSGWRVDLWNAHTGEHVGGPWNPGQPCRLLELDGNTVKTVDVSGGLEWWGPRSERSLHRRRVHGAGGDALAWSRRIEREPGVILMSSRYDAVRVWQFGIDEPRSPLLLHTGVIKIGFVAETGRRAGTIDAGGVVRVWNVAAQRGVSIDHAAVSGQGFQQATFSNDGTRLLTWANGSSGVHVWDAASGERLHDFEHVETLECAAYSADGARVVTAVKDGSVRVWDALTGERVGEPRPHPQRTRCAAFSPDGRRIVTGCDDGKVRVWDATAEEEPLVTIDYGPEIVLAEFTPDGRRLFVAAGVSARLFDAESGEQITGGGRQDESGVAFAALSADGQLVATAGAAGDARVWDAHSGEPVTPWLAHTGGPKAVSFAQKVEHCAFSPDARLLATAARDGSARVWDVKTGALAAPPMPDGDVCVAFSPDGRWLATAGSSGVARVWNARTGAAITPQLLHESMVTSVEFDARGERLVTGSWDGVVHVWDLSLDAREIDAIARSAELYACRRVDASGGLVELSAEELCARWEVLRR